MNKNNLRLIVTFGLCFIGLLLIAPVGYLSIGWWLLGAVTGFNSNGILKLISKAEERQ